MNMTIIWAIVIIITVLVEVMTVTLVSIWFALGAMAALLALFLGANETIQVVVFGIVSLIALLSSRPLSKKILKGNITRTNVDRIIGKHALITKTIDCDHAGECKVMGEIWRATSLSNETIEAGQYGEVVAIEGVHVVLKKIETEGENK